MCIRALIGRFQQYFFLYGSFSFLSYGNLNNCQILVRPSLKRKPFLPALVRVEGILDVLDTLGEGNSVPRRYAPVQVSSSCESVNFGPAYIHSYRHSGYYFFSLSLSPRTLTRCPRLSRSLHRQPKISGYSRPEGLDCVNFSPRALRER